jgi:hypothetical protein
MSRQYFGDLLVEPISGDYTSFSATSETVLIPTAFTAINANEPRAGKVYELIVGGTVTTGTAGTLNITLRYGTTISGTALNGATATAGNPSQNYVPSITTAPFLFRCYLIFRSIGLTGANSTCVAYGNWSSGGAVATASSETAVDVGTVGAAISVDTSVASALWVGMTFSVAPTCLPKFHTWRSLN